MSKLTALLFGEAKFFFVFFRGGRPDPENAEKRRHFKPTHQQT
jgi:hypothetical protein